MTAKLYGFDRIFLHDTTERDPFVIDMVRADDYLKLEAKIAALQEQVRALAAKNSVLKNAVEQCKEFFKAWVLNRISPYNGAYLNALCAHAIEETPATDAFIREIRAQSLDAASDELKSLATRSEGASSEHIHAAALYLMTLSASIRAGDQP